MSNFKRTNNSDFAYVNMEMVSSIKIMKFNPYEGVKGNESGVLLTMADMKTTILLPADTREEAEQMAISLMEQEK